MTTNPAPTTEHALALHNRVDNIRLRHFLDASNPKTFIEALKVRIHTWEPVPDEPGTFVAILLDKATTPGTWYAIHLADAPHPYVTDPAVWANAPTLRPHLLHDAVTSPLAGPEPSLDDLIQTLMAAPAWEDDRERFVVRDGITKPKYAAELGHHVVQHWPTGTLLAAAMKWMEPADVDVHKTLAALTNPQIVGALHAHSNFHFNRGDGTNWQRLDRLVGHAAHRLWPDLVPNPHHWDADPHMAWLAFFVPDNQWDAHLARHLLYDATDPDSRTYRDLFAAWNETYPDRPFSRFDPTKEQR